MDNPVENTGALPLPSKTPLWRRILKRVLITLTVLVLLLVTAALVIGYFYGDTIKQYAIDELNKHLNTQVFIEPKNIDFTVLQNFPNASVDFKSVEALDASDKKIKDTLFKAAYISFQFNIWDVF